MDVREIGYGDKKWMELAQDCILWWDLVLVALSLPVLLSEN
jgi:hypothetical protein